MDLEALQQENTRLRAELARTLLRAERAEQTLAYVSEAHVTLARHAAGVTLRRDGVTLVKGEERKRELAALRQANRRIRLHAVTVTPQSDVTSPPPSPSNRSDDRGALTVVTPRAARDGRRDTRRDRVERRHHRTPETLPAEIRALRDAWNELCAPHGFPEWGLQTSAQHVADAQAALERRPLEEWRRAFALVPRSPVCRGEVGRRRMRASIIWLLRGRLDDGYEPAEKLLAGAWSIDPEGAGDDAGEDGLPVVDCEHLAPGAGGEAALEAWGVVLNAIHAEGKAQALENLRDIAPVTVEAGRLVLWCPDEHNRTWMERNYRESLEQRLADLEVGVSAVAFVLSGPPAKDPLPPAEERPPPALSTEALRAMRFVPQGEEAGEQPLEPPDEPGAGAL